MAAYLPFELPEPVVIALLREAQLDSGINPAMIYDRTLSTALAKAAALF